MAQVIARPDRIREFRHDQPSARGGRRQSLCPGHPGRPAASPTGDPWLLTPGPLTTSPGVKQAMLHDYGSRDAHFIAVNRR
ncbi:MAG: hypothetical protein IIC53_06525, partial [Proteobacteria bacterium]|nr:hypothetical protein [Pseudomonadota bacterium]